MQPTCADHVTPRSPKLSAAQAGNSWRRKRAQLSRSATRPRPGSPSPGQELRRPLPRDEHGGYFDHVDPPAAVNPDGINSPAPGDTASFAPSFAFDRLGLRVPALLASPYLPKGVVCSTPLQHTSVLGTVRKLFGISGSLTRRDAAAPTFENLFLPAPRSDAPTLLVPPAAKAQISFDATRAAPDDVMMEMARDWRTVTSALPGAAAAAVMPTSQEEVHQFLKNQVLAFLDSAPSAAHNARAPRPASRCPRMRAQLSALTSATPRGVPQPVTASNPALAA